MQILIVDDHQLFRSGLRFLLQELDENLQFEEADTCEQALEILDQKPVELVLLDFHLPGLEGIDALAQIKKLHTCSVVVLSAIDEPRIIRQAIAGGASGYIPKTSSPEVLVAALHLVLSHGIYLPPSILESYHEQREQVCSDEQELHRQEVLRQLSNRQLDVLIKAAQGKPNKVIARDLHIAEGTVKAHLSACYRILEVGNRTEAVFATASLGLAHR